MKILSITFGCLMLLAAPVLAEDNSDLKALMTGNDSRGWEAVGRLEFGGQAFCTGALIAPDLVLTAAHCLFDKNTGRQFGPDEVEFLAGWRNGRANATRGVSKVVPHPGFEYQSNDRISRVAYDVALLKLDRPVRNSSVTPFLTGDKPRKGEKVGVVSYAHDRAQSPSLQEVCHVLARQSGTLVLSCDVDFGSSGAPIFSIDENGVAQIVSVISAKAEVRGRTVALGTSLQEPLDELLSLVARSQDVAASGKPKSRILNMGGANKDAGAKFLRP